MAERYQRFLETLRDIFRMPYDPTNMEPHLGKTFVTHRGYRIREDGTLTGNEDTEGAKIIMLAGIDPKRDLEASVMLNGYPSFQEFVLRCGQEPKKGLILAAVLAEEDAKRFERNGIITSPIKDII